MSAYNVNQRLNTRRNLSGIPLRVAPLTKKNKTVNDKWNIISKCLKSSRIKYNGRHMISADVTETVAMQHNLSTTQVKRIFSDYNNQNCQQIGIVSMEPKLRPGRPLSIHQQVNDEVISTAIKRLTREAGQLITYAELSDALNNEGYFTCPMTVWRISVHLLKCQMKYLHIRPILTPANKIRRLK